MSNLAINISFKLGLLRCYFFELLTSHRYGEYDRVIDEARLQGITISEADRKAWINSLFKGMTDSETKQVVSELRTRYQVGKMSITQKARARSQLASGRWLTR